MRIFDRIFNTVEDAFEPIIEKIGDIIEDIVTETSYPTDYTPSNVLPTDEEPLPADDGVFSPTPTVPIKPVKEPLDESVYPFSYTEEELEALWLSDKTSFTDNKALAQPLDEAGIYAVINGTAVVDSVNLHGNIRHLKQVRNALKERVDAGKMTEEQALDRYVEIVREYRSTHGNNHFVPSWNEEEENINVATAR